MTPHNSLKRTEGATYTGLPPETFRGFKDHLLTISWDPSIADIFPEGCNESISAGVGSESFVGPVRKESQTHSYCEGWTKKPSPKLRYLAQVRLPSGSIITVGGAAEAADFDAALSVFREAVATLRVLSRP